MICKSCGGVFSDDEVKCPYCGTMHLAGATAAYRQKIEDINEDLAELGDLPAESYKETVTSQGRKVFKIILITVAILFGILLLAYLPILIFEKNASYNDADYLKAQMLWEQEHFSELDALYTAGDYQGLLALEDALYAEDNSFSIYNWEHSDFLSAYRIYNEFLISKAVYDTGEEISNIEYSSILNFAVAKYETNLYQTYTEEELVLLASYRAEATSFLEESLGLTEDDLSAFYQDCMEKYDWVSYSRCAEYIDALPR